MALLLFDVVVLRVVLLMLVMVASCVVCVVLVLSFVCICVWYGGVDVDGGVVVVGVVGIVAGTGVGVADTVVGWGVGVGMHT